MKYYLCSTLELKGFQFRKDTYETIVQWLKNQDTHPGLISIFHIILLGRGGLIHREDIQIGARFFRRVKILGRTLLMQCILPRGIASIQQGYYEHIGSRRTGKRWACILCDKLITATHDIWIKRNSM